MRHYLGNLFSHIDHHKWTYAMLIGAMALAVAKAAETPGATFLTISTTEGLIKIPALLIDGVVAPIKGNLCTYFNLFKQFCMVNGLSSYGESQVEGKIVSSFVGSTYENGQNLFCVAAREFARQIGDTGGAAELCQGITLGLK